MRRPSRAPPRPAPCRNALSCSLIARCNGPLLPVVRPSFSAGGGGGRRGRFDFSSLLEPAALAGGYNRAERARPEPWPSPCHGMALPVTLDNGGLVAFSLHFRPFSGRALKMHSQSRLFFCRSSGRRVDTAVRRPRHARRSARLCSGVLCCHVSLCRRAAAGSAKPGRKGGPLHPAARGGTRSVTAGALPPSDQISIGETTVKRGESKAKHGENEAKTRREQGETRRNKAKTRRKQGEARRKQDETRAQGDRTAATAQGARPRPRRLQRVQQSLRVTKWKTATLGSVCETPAGTNND